MSDDAARDVRATAGRDGAPSWSAAGSPGSPPRSRSPTPGARHAARRPAAPRRARLLLPARRAHRRQRPARLPALLHRLPLVPRPHRRRGARPAAGPARRARPRRRPGPRAAARAGSAATRCPCRCTWRAASPRYPHLSLAERARVGRAALALKAARPRRPGAGRAGLRQLAGRARPVARAPSRRCGTWSASPPSTRSPRDASLGLAAMVFKTGLLSEPGRGRHRLGARPAGRTARHAGPQGARLRGRAHRTPYPRHLHLRGRRRTARLERSGARRDARRRRRRPRRTAARGARPAARTARSTTPTGCCEIGTAPILNVHVVYDRKVLRRPFFAALGTPVQWVFDRTDASGLGRRRPVPGAVPVGRAGRDRRARRRAARAVSARAGAAAARARAAPRYGTSSSPGSAPRRSPPPPASGGCGPAPAPRPPASTWPERGPPPGGPRPWRVRSAAA